jgi:Signal transduction histidine kinase
LCNKKFKNENYYCDVKSQTDYSIRLIKDNLKGKSIEFDTSLVNPTKILLHPGEFQTILLNLLENSVYWLGKKYRGDGGEVVVSATPNNGFLIINVSDNGPGVDPTMKDRIFEPGVTAKLDGFGMGLVVVNEIVTSHGGYLKNVQPGDIGGATFEFSLPISKDTEK